MISKNQTAEPKAEVFDLQGACKYLDTSYRVLKKILAKGELKYRQIDSRFFVTRQALDQWLMGSDAGGDE